jgi:flagellin
MSLVISTNQSSINAQRNLVSTGRDLNQSIERLSSGLKVNSASDDAAGMAVTINLRAQIRGFEQAIENANDGIAILQTTEGSYNSISDILIRMRELAVQSANDTLTNKERGYLDTEFEDLTAEITRIANVAEYNGVPLLTGTAGDGAGNMVFQVGTRNTLNDQIQINLGAQDSDTLAITPLDITTLGTAQGAITAIDSALDVLADDRAILGSKINEMTAAVDNLAVTVENLSTANSQIRDADISRESAAFTKNNVLMQSGVSMLSQANSVPQMALKLIG